jgi:hypothetical protein
METTHTGTITYFSMEIALDPGIPTYSGGLGILAGDTLRAAADRALPMVAVSLMYRCGFLSKAWTSRDGKVKRVTIGSPKTCCTSCRNESPLSSRGGRFRSGLAVRNPGYQGGTVPFYSSIPICPRTARGTAS